MALLDLLRDPSAYKFNSKQKNYLPNATGGYGPLLGRRVEFDVTDVQANPTFLDGTINHATPVSEDVFARGGITVANDRRQTDKERIKEWFKTPIGTQWIAKQVTLQALNKKPQFLYNLGLNTLQSVGQAGLSNVQRGGILSLGGFDVAEALGANVDYLTGDEFRGIEGKKGELLKENNYNLGDPGKKGAVNNIDDLLKSINPFAKNEGYAVKVTSKIDKLNALPIIEIDDTPQFSQDFAKGTKDFVKFQFEVKTYDNSNKNHVIAFRAFLDNLSDDYSANHNSYKFNGRGEKFYIYESFDRKISLSFKIAAQSRWEMKPLYQKLNYLISQTAPNYSMEGRIRTPYMFLTVGDWCNRIPGLLTSANLKWNTNYPWEIALDKGNAEEKGKDADMLVLPHVLDVSISFQPIHSFTPNNNPHTPFIGIDNGDATWRSQPTSNIPQYNEEGGLFNSLFGSGDNSIF